MKAYYLFSLLLLSLLACKENHQALAIVQEDPGKNYVRVADIQRATSIPPIQTMGMVASATQKQLSFKVGGIVQAMQVDEGDRFRKGEVLASLDRQEINSQVKKAQEQVAKYQRDLERTRNLYADSAATLENVQDLTTALEVANSDLEIARFNLQYAVVTAPDDGKVLQKLMEEGELASPGRPVLLIAATNSGKNVVKASVSDRQLVQLGLGDPATVSFDAYPDRVFRGNVSQIAEQADPRTATFTIEVEMATEEVQLKEGLIASVSLFPTTDQSYLKVPIDALVEGEGQTATVYSLDSGRAKQQQLKYHFIDAESMYVLPTNAMQAGTQVVVSSQGTMLAGQELIIQSTKQ